MDNSSYCNFLSKVSIKLNFMDNRILVTLLKSPIISNDTVMDQSDKIPVGIIVESLVIEFHKEKYEEFLSYSCCKPKIST